MADIFNIAGRIHSTSQEEVALTANEVLDTTQDKKQSAVNSAVQSDLNGVHDDLDGANGIKGRVATLEAQVAFDGDFQAENTAEGITTGSGKIVTANAARGAIDVRTGYFVCGTLAATAAKAVTAGGFVLTGGGAIKIKMKYANTAASGVTLNINSTDAKTIYYNGGDVNASNTWEAGEVVEVYYDPSANGNAGAYYANNVAGGAGDGVFDLTAKTGDSYATLSAALTAANTAIPASKKKGGMSIKYVQTYDNNSVNKYVQYRLMAQNFTTDVTQWQGVDEEPTAGSTNLVESGSVYVEELQDVKINPLNLLDVNDKNTIEGYFINVNGNQQENAQCNISGFIKVKPNTEYSCTRIVNGTVTFLGSISLYARFYDEHLNILSDSAMPSVTPFVLTTPANCAFMKVSYSNGDSQQMIVEGDTRPANYSAYNPIEKYVSDLNNIIGKQQLKDYAVVKDKVSGLSIGGDKIEENSVSIRKLGGAVSKSSNLYNKNDTDCVNNSYVNYTNGVISPSPGSTYKASGWISVKAGYYYIVGTRSGQAAFYDANKKYISGVVNLYSAVQAPTNAAYLRFSVYIDDDNFTRLTESVTSIESALGYEDYFYNVEVPGLTATPQNNSVDKSKIKGTLVKSTNLYNKDDADCEPGKYISKDSGAIFSAPTLKASGWIPVVAGNYYVVGRGRSNQYAFYGSKDVSSYISGGASLSNAVQAPEGAKYIRVSVYIDDDNFTTLNQGQTKLPYEPYYEYKTLKDVSCDQISKEAINGGLAIKTITSRCWNGALSVSADSLANTESLTLTDYPKSLKQGDRIILYAKVTSWGNGITIGKGTTDYSSTYAEITATQVIVKIYDGTVHTISTQDHGLTIETFVKVVIDTSATKWKIILQTLQGTYTEEVDCSYGNGSPLIKSNGASLTNVELKATNSYFKSPIWMFGDSYFGINTPIRELYWLNQWGYLNVLVQGYAGQVSVHAFSDFERCFEISKPKYIVWCLGMNDNTSLADWQSYITAIKARCDVYGIELILATIPQCANTTSYKYKDAMSQWIREESGCRYIDVAKAVGSDEYGHWYGYGETWNYQSDDNVHPSEYGAKAIASQFLIDFPEIMQY